MNFAVTVGLSLQQLRQRGFGSLSGLGELDFCQPSGGAASVLVGVLSFAVGRLLQPFHIGGYDEVA